ncbi:GNAT family N-acetyltransferase [Paenibacillus pinistramenti]|uniref:GNAT family N-acetyltransferase n=1 Tax=Paenibacillus pinistramenti TaxID=1768003 RepID=UPI001109CDD6|nr:GNAT family N-acetyltransferase [Paenibacillus pinistramenti]
MKDILRAYKQASVDELPGYCIPIFVNGRQRGRLRPVTADLLNREDEIEMMTQWREASSSWFTSQFPMSAEGTKRWIKEQVIEADDRILFMVEDEELTPVGQVGLLHYDDQAKECEFDNLLRGRKGKFGNIMVYALIALGEWSITVLGLQTGYIRVLADNFRAIRIYQSLGAQEVERIPLVKVELDGVLRWVPSEQPAGEGEAAERELLTMRIKREHFLQLQGSSLKKE